MRHRATSALAAAALLTALSGCALGPADPLLYDDEGLLRESIGIGEVETAGIESGCAGLLDSSQQAPEELRIPIEGGGGAVLVAVGGFALCVDDEDPGAGGDPLPEYDPVEPTGLGDGQSVSQSGDDTDGDEGGTDSDPGLDLVVDPTVGPTGGNNSRPVTLTADPTPQPIKD